MVENLQYNEFIFEKEINDTKSYFINKKLIIFNKKTSQEKQYIFLNNNLKLSNYILRISNFINWLEIANKNDVEIYFNDAMPAENIINKKWYEEYEILNIVIEIYGQGKMNCTIYLYNDNVQDHHDRELIMLLDEPI